LGKNLTKEINLSIKKNDYVKEDLMLTGADAISLGALSGGCNYVCGYPMSPSTTVLEKMAGYSKNFDVIVEQVEDEVGVVNMALGAWYAGARALVTTSGGGFALMSEGISLCGMIESPLVIHLAQRPGPATGLPTRTEQGDLNLALYAGHGEFPRIILSPGTIEEGFYLSQLSFNISDKFQVPVFILTDQFFVDTYYNTPNFDLTDLKVEKYIVKTEKDYKRFLLTKDGISQRGIPGFGKGNVCVDSDEHDEGGYITEDLDLRTKMVDKRLKKIKSIKKDIIKPKLIGNKNYKILVVCWGSTFNTVVESVQNLNNKDIAVLHFSWIYPFPDNIDKYFQKAEQVIIIENNSTSQFSQLIKLETGFDIKHKILKYNGLPFSVEEIAKEIKKHVKTGGKNE
jgi:2-oxoglutarate ferredoxin oxidoreductase subunit alpha